MKFFFHYNKPASIKREKPTISLHYNKTCHLIDNIHCEVKTISKINKRQPRFVMVGSASDIKIKNNKAYIS